MIITMPSNEWSRTRAEVAQKLTHYLVPVPDSPPREVPRIAWVGPCTCDCCGVGPGQLHIPGPPWPPGSPLSALHPECVNEPCPVCKGHACSCGCGLRAYAISPATITKEEAAWLKRMGITL